MCRPAPDLPLTTNARVQDVPLRRGFRQIFCRPATGVVIGGVVVGPDRLRTHPAGIAIGRRTAFR